MPEQQRILILDDDAEILELLTRILGGKYALLTKTNTDNLEEDIAGFQPSAIIIDHFIGDTTSKEIIDKSLENFKNIPVILHSAHEEIERLSLDAKVTSYIKKPSGIQEIRQCIADVLDK